MSDAPIYDPVELRRRIVVCFSIGELRDLAEQLGVGGVVWERGIQEAAREVVRQCERYAGLPALVAKLRETRPLVEWPEAAPAAPDAPDAPSFAAAPPEGSFAPAAMSATQPAGSFAPAVMGASPPAAPAPLADPFSPAPPPPRAAPVASPVWPVAPAVRPPTGLDPRILVVVAAMMLLAAVIAYLAGRASSGTPAAAAPAGSAEPAPRADGPASLAANALDRAYHNLARACELSPGGGELIFRRVFERCGPPVASPRPRVEPEPPPPIVEPSDEPPPEPRPGRKRAAPRAGSEEPATPRGCSQGCEAEHRTCVRRCGPEPTASSEYQGFQACLGRCLSDLPRCRASCR